MIKKKEYNYWDASVHKFHGKKNPTFTGCEKIHKYINQPAKMKCKKKTYFM